MPSTSQPRPLHVTCVDREAGCEGRKGKVGKPLHPTWYKNEKLQGLGVTYAMHTCAP